jgi:hypothetical protein
MEKIIGTALILVGAWMIYADIKTFKQMGYSPIAGLIATFGIVISLVGVSCIYAN